MPVKYTFSSCDVFPHCLSDGKDEPMEQKERVRFLAQGEEIFSVTLHPKAADVFIGNYYTFYANTLIFCLHAGGLKFKKGSGTLSI